ncbi:hypothetical protein H5410_034553 [Solanum commersonii]|uniref:Transmembrane protein n=1 Tax=Solanum commersonii TaxID=4109 RepID=A0A9J5YTQ3_SOLCO|nr:hypothetical protein H5410_034553 [Solanum commersonii]
MAPSGNSSSSGKHSVVVTALDGVINVNSLFTIAIFVGLSLASPGQKSLNSSERCQPGILTVKQLVIFEVLSFSFFLFLSLVAQAIKLSLNLLYSEDLSHGFSVIVNGTLLRAGMLMTAISSVMGCLFLMVSMLNVIEIKTGMLICGAKSTIISVTFLIILVSSGLLVYISAACSDTASAIGTDETSPVEIPPSIISALNVEKALLGIAITDIDHYGILGLSRKCSYAEESYSILSTPEERRLYDWSLVRSEAPDDYKWPFEVDPTPPSTGTPPPQEPEDVEPTILVGYFFLGWFVLAAVLSIALNL